VFYYEDENLTCNLVQKGFFGYAIIEQSNIALKIRNVRIVGKQDKCQNKASPLKKIYSFFINNLNERCKVRESNVGDASHRKRWAGRASQSGQGHARAEKTVCYCYCTVFCAHCTVFCAIPDEKRVSTVRCTLPSHERPVGTHNRQTGNHPEVAHMVRLGGGCKQSVRQEATMTETITPMQSSSQLEGFCRRQQTGEGYREPRVRQRHCLTWTRHWRRSVYRVFRGRGF